MPISFEEARRQILAATTPLSAERVQLRDSVGRALAEDFYATWDLPRYDNSAMDGFAIQAADAAAETVLLIKTKRILSRHQSTLELRGPGPPAPPHRIPQRSLPHGCNAKGLQLVDSNQVTQLFRDPRYQQELVVFVDAPNDQNYQDGHIPGAYQFDHYRAENYFASVLPSCQSAEQVVVYCTGGDCEDSEFAAVFLRDAGIPKERLFVYGGGMTEWATNGLPVEIGARNSGNFAQPNHELRTTKT